jgi:hypothetical protein
MSGRFSDNLVGCQSLLRTTALVYISGVLRMVRSGQNFNPRRNGVQDKRRQSEPPVFGQDCLTYFTPCFCTMVK